MRPAPSEAIAAIARGRMRRMSRRRGSAGTLGIVSSTRPCRATASSMHPWPRARARLALRSNRDVRVAGDVRHVHAAEPGFVDLEATPALGELLDCDAALHAGERGAEAAVHAMAEPDGDAGLAFDVEFVRSLELAGIARCRAGDQKRRKTGWDRPTFEGALLDAVPPLVLRRRPVAKDLVDGLRD